MKILGFSFKRLWPFGRLRDRRIKEMKALAGCFKTLEQLAAAGMLAWNVKDRRLFVMQPLAVVMIQTAESWQNFVQNVFQWTYYHACQQAWNDLMLREELAAVRRASVGANHEKVALSRDDVDRIRRARRAEIAQEDLEPPKVEPFEIFILPDSKEAAPKPIAVGYFDPEANQMELAPFDEIEPLLKQGE